MPVVSMRTFAKFCAAGIGSSEGVVREAHEVANAQRYTEDGKSKYMGRNPYQALNDLVQRYHAKSGRLVVLEQSIEDFLAKTRDADRRDMYGMLLPHYISVWKQKPAKAFEVPRGSVEVNGLTITVNPEIGMRQPNRVLKIWWLKDEPSKEEQSVMLYLMKKARDEQQDWLNGWKVALLDVRREVIVPACSHSASFKRGLDRQASQFVDIWNSLDR